MCVCVDCACPTGDWPPCDRPVLTEPARVPLLARCRTGAAAAGHLHSHALLPWDALVLPRRLDMCSRQGGGEQVGARVALQNGLAESLETGAVPSYVPWELVVGIPVTIVRPFLRNGIALLGMRPCTCCPAGAWGWVRSLLKNVHGARIVRDEGESGWVG